MIAALLTDFAASPCMRVALRYCAVVLAVILFLLGNVDKWQRLKLKQAMSIKPNKLLRFCRIRIIGSA